MNYLELAKEQFYTLKEETLNEDRHCLGAANSKEYEKLQASLLSQMENELTAQGDPRMAGNGHVFDEYTYAHCTNVCVYSLTIGLKLGLDRERLSVM